MEKNVVIIAPHADDEIIGCFELLEKGVVQSVLFSTPAALEEAKNLCKYYNVETGVYQGLRSFTKKNILLFPDPTHELHPLHRQLGAMGEELLREGYSVIFYSTNMSAPYIKECGNSLKKRGVLDKIYPDKKSLWQFDHKYFLFEGYVKWIMKWQD